MKPICITDSISITKSRGLNQRCIVCNTIIGKNIAFNLHNYNDGLVLKKNVWVHIGCRQDLNRTLNKAVKKHGEQIFLELL